MPSKTDKRPAAARARADRVWTANPPRTALGLYVLAWVRRNGWSLREWSGLAGITHAYTFEVMRGKRTASENFLAALPKEARRFALADRLLAAVEEERPPWMTRLNRCASS
jgi:hypothetical protein